MALFTLCHAHPVMTRRLFEARHLLRTQCLIPPAYKQGLRLFEEGVYSRKYRTCIMFQSIVTIDMIVMLTQQILFDLQIPH